MKKRLAILFLATAALLLSGCSFVRIQNVSASEATVSVLVPDSGSAYTRIIPSGGIVDVFSSHGGRYVITTIPSEQYKEILNQLEQQITDRLFNERASLSPEEVRQLTENLNHILRLQEQLSDPGVSCSGSLGDFDTSVATISFDNFNNEWILECGSSTGN